MRRSSKKEISGLKQANPINRNKKGTRSTWVAQLRIEFESLEVNSELHELGAKIEPVRVIHTQVICSFLHPLLFSIFLNDMPADPVLSPVVSWHSRRPSCIQTPKARPWHLPLRCGRKSPHILRRTILPNQDFSARRYVHTGHLPWGSFETPTPFDSLLSPRKIDVKLRHLSLKSSLCPNTNVPDGLASFFASRQLGESNRLWCKPVKGTRSAEVNIDLSRLFTLFVEIRSARRDSGRTTMDGSQRFKGCDIGYALAACSRKSLLRGCMYRHSLWM